MSMSLLDLIVALTQTASLPSEHARAKGDVIESCSGLWSPWRS
jgi:hypothetical protein